ncbi:phosphodiester glycosidase family protein [Deinococcus sp.]|uniref:phosphodiester glycosidase family protein n=1 Tax=Deinococcus sp. TaxID=47478 RepID=UPI003C7B9A3B
MHSRPLLLVLGLTLALGAGLTFLNRERAAPAPPVVQYSAEVPGAQPNLQPPHQEPPRPRPQQNPLPAPARPRPVLAFAPPPPPTPVLGVLPPDTSLLRENVAVQLSQVKMGRVQVALLRGGQPVSRHVLWRSSVGEFIRAAGAVAGVNGTFFKDAAIASNDSNMLGPMLTPDGHFLSETDPKQLKKITGRPLVAWSHDQFLVTAFEPLSMNRKAQVQALLPGMTDAFLAGGWLVHGGQALSAAAMMVHAPKDAQEVRPRVFFGVTTEGLVIAGATVTPVSSSRLAQIAQAAGAREAVLMDSGYSTSLIYGSRVLAVGHKTRKVPSRPVPHAIVFMNPVLATVQVGAP